MGATDQAAGAAPLTPDQIEPLRVLAAAGGPHALLSRIVATLDTALARVAERDRLLCAGLEACEGYRLTLPETTLHQACYEAFFEDFEREARALLGHGDGAAREG